MFDRVIADALVVDGTGAPGFPGWVGLRGEYIRAIGRGSAPGAAMIVDGSGLVLAPGFVDVHNHSDLSPFLLPCMPSTLRQGITTVVVGNCGSSPWPRAGWEEAVLLANGDPAELPAFAWRSWGDYLDAIDVARPAVNVATLIGHGSVRREVMGLERRYPTAEELERMHRLVAEAIHEGAAGLSTGLIYVPGIFSRTDEVIALAEAAAAQGGLYASHIRGEGRDLFTAVEEAIRIGQVAGLPVHVSHLKCESARVWGKAGELLGRIHAAGATGDQYPYAAWNSSLSSLLPAWAAVVSVAAIAASHHERLRAAVEDGEADFQSSVDGVGWDAIVITDTIDSRFNGMGVAAIADALSCDPFDAFVALLTEAPETACIGHAMREDDVSAILADPEVFVASDASAVSPDSPAGSLPVHPREYGTFPRALALSRDLGLLPLEAVIRKMTLLPAERFGLAGRGKIAEGAFADLVLFDAEAIRDVATFEEPHAFPIGIHTVLVNGQVAWQQGSPEVIRAGRALRRGA